MPVLLTSGLAPPGWDTGRFALRPCMPREKLPTVMFLRWESPVLNSRGGHTGIFGLANDLAHSGRLTASDWAWWRWNNAWFDAAYPDPAVTDPLLFDRATNPVTTCWFKDTADHLLGRVPGYLALLDRYAVAWAERSSDNPGRVLYEDTVQVVVTQVSVQSGHR